MKPKIILIILIATIFLTSCFSTKKVGYALTELKIKNGKIETRQLEKPTPLPDTVLKVLMIIRY